MVVAYFKVLLCHLPGGAVENTKEYISQDSWCPG